MKNHRNIRLGIQKKLLISFLSLSVLPIIIGGKLCFDTTRHQIEKNTEARLHSLAGDYGDQINNHILTHYQSIKLLSQAYIFQGDDTYLKQSYIEKAKNAYPFYDAITVIDRNGVIIACTKKECIGQTRADREWFYNTVRSKQGEIVSLDAYEAETANWEMAIGFNLPVIHEKTNETIGVLTTRMTIDNLGRRVKAFNGESEIFTRVYLVNSGGEILAVSDEKGGLSISNRNDNFQLITYIDPKTGTSGYKDNTGEDLISAEYLIKGGSDFNGWGWAVIVTEPVSKAYQLACIVRNMMSLLIITVAVLITIFAVFASRRFSKTIGELSESASQISRGNLQPIKIEYKPNDEIGVLVDSFNKMATDLYATTVSRDSLIKEIAERKRVEKEKIRLEARLYQSHKMEAVATLAGGIAHQFNNALSSVLGNIEMLKMISPNDENTAKFIKPMENSAHRMAGLTSQLLAYARGGKYHPRTILLSDFVDGALPLIRHTIKRTISVETDLAHDIFGVEVDLTQMQMVILSVITNADEAIKDRGVIRIIAKNAEIDEGFEKSHPEYKRGAYACLTVEDDGRGMDEKTKSRVFEPFFTTKFQGRGLGMAAAYGVVKNHDGYIWIDSELNKGTKVSIYLPAVKTEKNEPKKQKPQLLEGTGTILVIEDEKIIMELTCMILKRLGYQVLEAKTGKEAVDLARTFDGVIDLAILDFVLPDMSGKEIYPLLKGAHPDLKVIVCSGHDKHGHAKEILDAGAQAFIQKPYSYEELSEKIKEVLEGNT